MDFNCGFQCCPEPIAVNHHTLEVVNFRVQEHRLTRCELIPTESLVVSKADDLVTEAHIPQLQVGVSRHHPNLSEPAPTYWLSCAPQFRQVGCRRRNQVSGAKSGTLARSEGRAEMP